MSNLVGKTTMVDEIKEIQERFKIIGREEELRKALAAIRIGQHLLIEGAVGVGKTVVSLTAANYLQRPFYRVDGDERYTEQKLTGWFDPPIVLKKGYVKEAFLPGSLNLAMVDGGILFINEINRLPEGVQNVLLPAMDEGKIEIPKIGEIKANKEFVIIATQNPAEYVATTALSEALRDRFELITLDYQPEEEEIKIVEANTGITDINLVMLAVKIARATRNHPDIRRGASVRAAMSIALLVSQLGSSYSTIREACHMTLPTRIEMKEDASKPVHEVIDEILKTVAGELKKESQGLKLEIPSDKSLMTPALTQPS